MEAMKRMVRVSKNHEIRIKVPQHIPENESVEVILIIGKKTASFDRKISEFKETTEDCLFQNDLNEISEDFKYTDSEGWDRNNGI